MRDVNINATKGVRNDLPLERFGKGDLAAGVNVDIDNSGKISRRKGLRRVLAGTDTHSLGAAADRAFYVDDTTLYEIDTAFNSLFRKSGLAVGRRMAYLNINGAIYFSNGVDSGAIVGSHVQSLGIVPPITLAVTPAAGNLPAGTYGVTMTYARLDGTESGAPGCAFVDGAGISFSNLPVSSDPDVMTKRIYVTELNGDAPYLAMVLPNSATSAAYLDAGPRALLCTTQFKTAMPAGDVLGFYNGRLFVGVGNVLFYSDAYNLGLCDMRQGYVAFSSRVTIVAPVSDGVFVGTETETVFLAGADPADFQLAVMSPFGSVFGTLAEVDPRFVTKDGLKGKTQMWTTTRGVCAGSSGGTFTELTKGRYILPDVSSGASLYRYDAGDAHFVSVLYK